MTFPTSSIPEPPGWPYFGNITEFRSADSLKDFDRLHDLYGEIFRLRFPGTSFVFAGSNKLVNELCDESRFKKSVQGELAEVRLLAGDGLFTADNEEENWGLAHRILVPAFGPVAIQGMFDEMHDIVSQMALKWARHGPSNPIPASEDFTRLALDTLALCSMGYRFNSFYKDTLHPFVQSMGDALIELGKRSQRPTWAKPLYRQSERELSNNIGLMRRIANDLINTRRANPTESSKADLLTAMMVGKDPKTGKKLSDESITNNLVTFLIAGHETTSGTLSFAFYSMLKNPHAYERARQEVDSIMGRDRITVEKLFKLKYLPAVLRETLRQCSPITGITMEPLEDTIIGGKYAVKKGEPIAAMFSRAHFDPAVFGEDAKEFKPERMLDDNFNRLQKEFPNCWKPFGNGMRACIGRPFAWQEMLLALSLLLQNFDFQLDDPSYVLSIAETLTIKPKDFFMRASLRHGMTPLDLDRQLRGGEAMTRPHDDTENIPQTTHGTETGLTAIKIFYGSNSGTCESLARRLALHAPANGFKAVTIDTIDSARDNLDHQAPNVFVVSSYEGQAPDNAAHFVAWLESLVGQEADNASYAVFGAGNSEWRQTFHRIPRLVDSELEEHGARRLVPLGLTDVSEQNPYTSFEAWEDNVLWPVLREKYSVEESGHKLEDLHLSVNVSNTRNTILGQNMREAIVTATKSLTTQGFPLKKHIEIELPDGVSYRSGDYLAVLPMNPRETVARVLRHFGLSWDAALTIKGSEATLLPLETPTSAVDILGLYVELSQPATKKDVLAVANLASDQRTKDELESLVAHEGFLSETASKRVSILDLLEKYAVTHLPIGTFLATLPPMRIRQYSISSSPLYDPRRVSLTYSVLDGLSAKNGSRHLGVATNYLASLEEGERLHVAVRRSKATFHLPADPESTPIICIATGAGIAPFRGFVQERAAQVEAGRSLAPALLIYGCRGRGDDLYREEFDAWEALGAVMVKRTYSRQSEATDEHKYVQDRIRSEKEELSNLWNTGAKLFVCGSRALGKGVETICAELFGRSKTELGAGGTWNDRIVMDIFD